MRRWRLLFISVLSVSAGVWAALSLWAMFSQWNAAMLGTMVVRCWILLASLLTALNAVSCLVRGRRAVPLFFGDEEPPAGND